jgi:carbon monoxide dehydrogenase subunit G
VDLRHQFSVPLGVEETWEHFQDIGALAECFPGATVTGVEDDTFKGTVKVKLGPIALLYTGSGTFVEKDDASHRYVVDAKGKDKRGNGTAGAKVTLSMSAAGAERTDVEVVTDLAVTGKPAQFGRGVMQDVSDKLLGQFVSCLEQRLAAPGEPEPADMPPPAAPAPPGKHMGEDPGVPEPEPASTRPEPPRPMSSAGTSTPTSAGAGDEALDLGSTVLPVLLRSYGPKVGAGLVVLLLVWWASRRRG